MDRSNTNYLQAIAKALPIFDRPIFILSSPRAGSTLLYETLAKSPDIWTIRGENHQLIETIATLNLSTRGYKSNILDATDVDLKIAIAVKLNFFKNLKNNQGIALSKDIYCIRMLEKTPKNALRISFLNAIFPDALFIYLYRDPQASISSIMEGWKSQRCITYANLPNWHGCNWSFLLIPNWSKLRDKPLVEIAASQWQIANEAIMDNLNASPCHRWCAVRYRDLVENPQAQVSKLCAFAGIKWYENSISNKLALSGSTITPPDFNKWHKNKAAIKSVLPQIKSTCRRFNKLTQPNS